MLLLVQLRWLAVIGQVVTIIYVSSWLGVALPLQAMGCVILFLIGLNCLSLLLFRSPRGVSNTGLFAELLLDMAALTAQLYLSGGASNPFVSLYLLQITLGAVLLAPWSTWILVATASVCFVVLSVYSRPIMLPHHEGTDLFELHIRGMFICFVLAAGLIVLFMNRINRNLRERDAYLADLRQQSAEEDHIVRMGLLASGAAHELGTPLATISVILGDWKKMPLLRKNAELMNDLKDMQTQLGRCKTIVSGILMSSGEARGEGTIRTTVRDFLDDLVEEWRSSRSPQELVYRNAFNPDRPIVSDAALKQVIFNILDNAQEASPHWIGISAERRADKLVLTVNDAGPGFAEQVLASFGKPYTSTKGRAGSGLGLFLVVNVVRKLGGTVSAENTSRGARVSLALPFDALANGEAHGG
nr:ATP-binding protein [Mesorhizobium sp. SP-1A]